MILRPMVCAISAVVSVSQLLIVLNTTGTQRAMTHPALDNLMQAMLHVISNRVIDCGETLQ